MVTKHRQVQDCPYSKQARLTLIVSVSITLVLYLVPYGYHVAYPFLLLSTLFHELGHGVSAILVGASFEELRMDPDGSGVALWRGNVGNLHRAIVAFGGLVGPATVAALLFLVARRQALARIALVFLGLLLLAAVALVIRNLFGLLFVGSFAIGCLVLSRWASSNACQLVVVFLAVQLALSVYSRGSYLFSQQAHTAMGTMPSDVQQIALALPLPYWFWGIVCAAFSTAILVLGGWRFLRN